MTDYRDSHQGAGDAAWYDARMYAPGTYDSWKWGLEQQWLGGGVRRRFDGRKVRHLDFACGTGRVLAFLEPLVDESTGLDISEEMLGLAREKAPGARLIHGDVTADPSLLEGPYDLITAFRFFTNAQDELRHQALDALAPALADDGALVLNVHGSTTSVRVLSYARRRYLRREQISTLSPGGMRRRLAAHGLRVVETHGLGLVTRGMYRRLGQERTQRLEDVLDRFGALRRVTVNQMFVAVRD